MCTWFCILAHCMVWVPRLQWLSQLFSGQLVSPPSSIPSLYTLRLAWSLGARTVIIEHGRPLYRATALESPFNSAWITIQQRLNYHSFVLLTPALVAVSCDIVQGCSIVTYSAIVNCPQCFFVSSLCVIATNHIYTSEAHRTNWISTTVW